MPTPVFLTIDTELVWRHHAAGLSLAKLVARSIDPAGVGIGYQLRELARHQLKGVFFVDPMPAVLFGIDVIKAIVDAILAAGQDIQLHIHPNWTGARVGDGGAAHAPFELADYSYAAQRALIAQARDLLVEAGAPPPVAFRAGSYAANDDTLRALADLGLTYDSSHNGAEAPWPSQVSLPPGQVAPCRHMGVVEVPVTVIHDLPGTYRHFQLCALSTGEMRAALDHAAAQEHGAVTIVSHGFELANRAGTRPNPLHLGRFSALCAMLAERRAALPTATFADCPPLVLDGDDRALGPDRLRTHWRQAQQMWSNLTTERRA